MTAFSIEGENIQLISLSLDFVPQIHNNTRLCVTRTYSIPWGNTQGICDKCRNLMLLDKTSSKIGKETTNYFTKSIFWIARRYFREG